MSSSDGLEALRDGLERTVAGVARIVDMPFNDFELAVLIVPLDPDVKPILLRAVVVQHPVPARRRTSRDAASAVLDIVDALIADDVPALSEWDPRWGSLSFGSGLVGLMVAVTQDDVIGLNEETDMLTRATARVAPGAR